ncbi:MULTISPECIES: class I SAM-dependent methyltransferase [unclassified Haladaptatus]|uniref:class I SAM-dependent methyltransferase n=1 Tax=unclassified Haladaptatus TaxID=2622732 RepID=UPI00209BCEE4|nr:MULTISPECIES: class I SAM-dependent methyltransferase [unclassified Haladaptatus]MCO8243535.1 methyltransferase domain-containing protein [Haladaptatus sp. AB643]MCO8254944.1 methyltransferase domain-containing protein [Haladaptatus sp. AB618]
MDIPRTVTTALADRPVSGATCLEAGAGMGNTTAGLLADGASRVYAVTNDPEHATAVRERFDGGEGGWTDSEGEGERTDGESGRTAVLEADLRALPLETDSVEIITAHGLFNLIGPPSLEAVATELTRVADLGCHLVVDDYRPPPDDAAVRELFALENAVAELATGKPALTFYPEAVLERLFAGYGWEFDRKRILLDPVPWTASHIEAHATAALSLCSRLRPELGEPLAAEVKRVATAIGEESTGTMYSVALRLPA